LVVALAYAEVITLCKVLAAFFGNILKKVKASSTFFHFTIFATKAIFLSDTNAYLSVAVRLLSTVFFVVSTITNIF